MRERFFPRKKRVRPERLQNAWLLAVLVALASCSSPSTTETKSAGWHETQLGLCEDYPEESRTLEGARRDLDFTQSIDAKVLRIAFGWDAMEPSPGKYDWSFWDDYVAAAAQRGIQLIPYICYTPRWAAKDQGEDYWRSPPRDPQDFARFVEAIVRHYRGEFRTWELWNEPDNQAYWLGTRAEFATLIRAGAAAVRRADPSAKVVLGGVAGNMDFLEALFREDHIAPAVDIVNFHTYLETWHPDPIERLPETIERAAHIVATYGEHEPLWLAEAGYSTVGPREHTSDSYRPRYTDEHTDQAQADALTRIVALALGSNELSAIAWYRINDLPTTEAVIGDDNNRHLGVLTRDGKEKPAAHALHELCRAFAQPYRTLPAPDHLEEPQFAAEVRFFELRDGRRLLFAWNAMPGSAQPGELMRADPRDQIVRLALPASNAARFHVWDEPTNESVTQTAGELRVRLRGSRVTVIEFTDILEGGAPSPPRHRVAMPMR